MSGPLLPRIWGVLRTWQSQAQKYQTRLQVTIISLVISSFGSSTWPLVGGPCRNTVVDFTRMRRHKQEASFASRHWGEPIKKHTLFLRGSKRERIKASNHVFKFRPDSFRKDLTKLMKVPTPNKKWKQNRTCWLSITLKTVVVVDPQVKVEDTESGREGRGRPEGCCWVFWKHSLKLEGSQLPWRTRVEY